MLQDFSSDELRAELVRREIEVKEKAKPQQVDNPDLAVLRKVCQEYIDSLYLNGYVDDDAIHDIYEAAMMAIFGKDVFAWIYEQ